MKSLGKLTAITPQVLGTFVIVFQSKYSRNIGRPSRLRPPPLGRQTDAVNVLLISDNGTVLWRRHRQL